MTDSPLTESRLHLEPRLTAARPDLAAAHLEGRVEAARFVEGHPAQVQVEFVDVKRWPRADAPVDTQLLYGETVVVYDEDDEGWSWVQADGDAYVGYVASHALGRALKPSTHRVVVNRTFLYPGPDMKLPVLGAVPLGGRVMAEATKDAFTKLSSGYAISSHLGGVDRPAHDFVTVAEGFLGAPYLWGGKSISGIDCSGLVQLAMSAANRTVPRDTDLQERHDATTVEVASGPDASRPNLRRGDLVFWKGHVGIMMDGEALLHANGHHMLVTREPLRAAEDRILKATGFPISSIRRFDHII